MCVIALASTIIAYISFEKNRQLTIHAVEQQLRVSRDVMSEKITMLKSSATRDEFSRKLAYALQLNERTYRDGGLKPLQFQITKDGELAVFPQFERPLPHIPAAEIKKMIAQKEGIRHVAGLTIAFSHQVELDDTLYAIALYDREYLRPVTEYRNFTVSLTLVTVLFASLLGYFTIRRILKPVVRLKQAMEQVGDGDLQASVAIPSLVKEIDALSYGFNQMVSRLKTLISQLETGVAHVTASSEKMSFASRETQNASEQIARTVGEVVAAMDRQAQSAEHGTAVVAHIAEGMNQVAHSIENVEASAELANQKAHTGQQLVAQTVAQMNRSQQTVNETAASVTALEQKSARIERIVRLISDIASQTNLLSLNAALEAARAGKHGQGFVVVAHEVKTLAQQSGQAAKEIRGIIEEIQRETEQVVQSMASGAVALEAGINMVRQTEQAFNDIATVAAKVSAESQAVSTVAHDVSGQTHHMVKEMNAITSVSQQIAASMEQVAGATEEQSASLDEVANEARSLHDLARELRNAVERLTG